MTKKLAVLGLGHIGKYVLDTLSLDASIIVQGYDLTLGHDLLDIKLLENIISNIDGVVASTPYFLNKKIAEICNKLGKDYFDLTESVEVTSYVKTLKNSRFVTQCGLAPGMVSIIANHLAGQLTQVETIQIRVGALPQNANNHMSYFRTWNTHGLINEYIHKCPSLVNGQLVDLEPLGDIEHVVVNGFDLEAANTSGGLGSLAESYLGIAQHVNYKTLRYKGHWQLMKFLKDDLGLKENFDTYVDLFNKHVPQTNKDFVYILVNVVGLANGTKTVRQYSKIIESNDKATAIQLSTAGGVMAVIDCWNKNQLANKMGWIKQEELDYSLVWNSKYSDCYKNI